LSERLRAAAWAGDVRALLGIADELAALEERLVALERLTAAEQRAAAGRSRGGHARAEAVRSDPWRREWALAVEAKLARRPELSQAEARRQVAREYATTEHRVRRAHEAHRKCGGR